MGESAVESLLRERMNALTNPTLAPYAKEGEVELRLTAKAAEETAALIPWTVGVVAGTAVNKSATNMDYDGEYSIDTSYTQTQLENGIKEGSWMFHTWMKSGGVGGHQHFHFYHG